MHLLFQNKVDISNTIFTKYIEIEVFNAHLLQHLLKLPYMTKTMMREYLQKVMALAIKFDSFN